MSHKDCLFGIIIAGMYFYFSKEDQEDLFTNIPKGSGEKQTVFLHFTYFRDLSDSPVFYPFEEGM